MTLDNDPGLVAGVPLSSLSRLSIDVRTLVVFVQTVTDQLVNPP